MSLTQEQERKLAGLLGLGLRARTVIVGVEQVRAAVRRDEVQLAVIAPDASPHSLDKVVPLLLARRVETVAGPGATGLGGMVGREQTAAIGIVDAGLAQGVRAIGLAPASLESYRRQG